MQNTPLLRQRPGAAARRRRDTREKHHQLFLSRFQQVEFHLGLLTPAVLMAVSRAGARHYQRHAGGRAARLVLGLRLVATSS